MSRRQPGAQYQPFASAAAPWYRCFFAWEVLVRGRLLRQRVLERRALGQFVEQACQARMRTAPVDFGKTEADPAQRAAYGHVAQGVVLASAISVFAQALFHRGQAQGDFTQLAFYPVCALLFGWAQSTL